MNLTHVITGLGIGGAEMMLVRLIERIEAANVRNTVISLTKPGPLAAHLDCLGVEVCWLGLMPGQLPGPRTLRWLVAALRRARPALVHGWMYHGNLAASIGCRLAGIQAPVVWSIHHSLGPRGELKPLTERIVRVSRWLSGSTAAVVFCSRISAAQHERAGFARMRSVIIPNGIDCDRFQPDIEAGRRLRTALGLAPDIPLVGMCARAHPMKDHASLIAAVGLLRQNDRSCHLVLAGSEVDPGNVALVGACEAAGIRDQVTLLGPRNDIERLMASLDVFVLPSAWGEAFPLVLGEALACGVPCIATDVGDCAWIVGDAGLVVPPGNVDALAAALRRLLVLSRGERRRLGEWGRRQVLARFSLPEVTRRYHELYHALVHHQPAPASSA
jgi:glycosyltransferase involved in cell wall biosynthesis